MEEIFDREIKLLGMEAFQKINASKVAVFGVGGVGSYAFEALLRAGIGKIAVVDADRVAFSNINRQLVADLESLGKKKVEVAVKRGKMINPTAEITAFCEFYSEENCSFIDLSEYDFIVDAIDSVSSKIFLIETAQKLNVPIISSMGAGNRLHPECFKIADIYKTEMCPLAKTMRYELRKRGIKKLPVVFSDEEPRKTGDKTIGSISFVPSAAGLCAAGYVIRHIIGEEK